jgi:hypothetical protein
VSPPETAATLGKPVLILAVDGIIDDPLIYRENGDDSNKAGILHDRASAVTQLPSPRQSGWVDRGAYHLRKRYDLVAASRWSSECDGSRSWLPCPLRARRA